LAIYLHGLLRLLSSLYRYVTLPTAQCIAHSLCLSVCLFVPSPVLRPNDKRTFSLGHLSYDLISPWTEFDKQINDHDDNDNNNNKKKSQSNLGRAASPALTHRLQWDAPRLPSKLPFRLRRSPPPSNTPVPRPTPLTTPNGIRIQSAVLPQYTFRTDRPTDRPTDKTGDNCVPSV